MNKYNIGDENDDKYLINENEWMKKNINKYKYNNTK
jgi:hypothetical protein